MLDVVVWASVAAPFIAALGLGFRTSRVNSWKRQAAARRAEAARESVTVIGDGLTDRGVLIPSAGIGDPSPQADVLNRKLLDCPTPIALEFRAVSGRELPQLTTSPLNASAHEAMARILHDRLPTSPTLYTAWLPHAERLVTGYGGGLRAFAKAANFRFASHAPVRTVATGDDADTAWEQLVCAVTVMVFDQVPVSEGGTATMDVELQDAIARMLDGQDIDDGWESAGRHAFREMATMRQRNHAIHRQVSGLVRDGKADYKRLSQALGGARKPKDDFYRHLEEARAVLATGHRASVATAAAAAVAATPAAGPGGPTCAYAEVVSVLKTHFAEVDRTDSELRAMLRTLRTVQLTSRNKLWGRGREVAMQMLLHAACTPPAPLSTPQPVEILALPSGELFRVDRRDPSMGRSAANP